MALKQSRPGFGLARAHRLSGDLLRGGPSRAVKEIALRTLRPWATFNAGTPLPEQVIEVIGAGTEPATEFDGGAEEVSAAEIRAAAQMDFLRFASARHSVRSFAPDPVPEEMLARAIKAAQQASSSCNRQTCRARI